MNIPFVTFKLLERKVPREGICIGIGKVVKQRLNTLYIIVYNMNQRGADGNGPRQLFICLI